jgi:hypothetical protein
MTERRRSIALRKLMLRRRDDHFHRCEAFEMLWDKVFPQHDLATLRLKRPFDRAEAYWDQGWAEAARKYHEDRKRYPPTRGRVA